VLAMPGLALVFLVLAQDVPMVLGVGL